MTTHKNEHGQSIGFPIQGWQECPYPPRSTIGGRYCQIESIDIEKHSQELFEAFAQDLDHKNWTYLPYGPFDQFESFKNWLDDTCTKDDPLFHTVIDKKTNKAAGIASYLRINPAVGTIEVGHIHFSPKLQRTPMASEAMYLMMRRVFDELGYRRYEWKCDALNELSNRAACRFGFMFEGIFRQATIYKNRNRDTAWYSILDSEWPEIKSAFENWLNPDNFDTHGVQKTKLMARVVNS